MQLRDEVEDLRLDVVHVGVLAEPHPIVVDRALLGTSAKVRSISALMSASPSYRLTLTRLPLM